MTTFESPFDIRAKTGNGRAQSPYSRFWPSRSPWLQEPGNLRFNTKLLGRPYSDIICPRMFRPRISSRPATATRARPGPTASFAIRATAP
jgi:hypothetical protein